MWEPSPQRKFQVSSIKWVPAKGTKKWFLLPLTTSMSDNHVRTKTSREHKVKAFANDLTIITADRNEHQEILPLLMIVAEKWTFVFDLITCFSMVFDGKSVSKKSSFEVGNGQTTNISDHLTAFLGSTACHNLKSTKRTAVSPLWKASSRASAN